MTLQTMFDYDLWANQRWLKPAEAMGESHVLQHVLKAGQIWLGRCKHLEADLREDLALSIRLEQSTAAWLAFLATADLNKEIFYTNSRGESYTNTVDSIAHHVFNHGTYHRGHLRGMAEERCADFPETDLIGFVRELEATDSKLA